MNNDLSHLGGWIDDKHAVEEVMKTLPFPVVGDCQDQIKGTGEGKTVLLYKYVEEILGGFNVRRQAIGDCRPKNTLILGPDGIKKIQDVKVNDRVYAGNGEITKVISTLCKKSYNPILTIHTKGGLPLKVTSDHKILAYKFSELAGSNRRYSPGFQKSCIQRRGEESKAKGNVVFKNRQAELVPASDLSTADYILCPINIEFDKSIPDEMLPYMGSEDLRWMIGLFLGDGHACTKKQNLEWGCTTDQPEIEKRLCKTLDDLGLTWNAYFHCRKISNKARKVYTHKCEKIYSLFKKHFYDEEGFKILPSWAINDDVIQGLLDADGYKTNNKYTTRVVLENTSLSLVSGVRLWALNKGYTPSLNQRQRKDKRTGNTNKFSYSVQWNIDKTSRNLWRDDQYFAMPITKIDIEEGPHDEVYDIGVKHPLHTLISTEGGVVSNCVSFGSAGAIDCLKAFEIKRLGQFEEWIAETSTEDIYGGSRVVVGNGRLGNGDGSTGAWAAKWVSQYGTLVRKDYGDFDLTTYSGSRAKSWGYRGFPKNEVIKYCKDYPVQTVSRVDTYEEARDLLANGYPVTIAGSLGFSSKRDEDGFARPSGSWAHQMFLAAIDDAGVDCKGGRRRPGVLVVNSWGKWNGGPKRLGQPDGSFWISPEDLNRYFRNGDCWAYSDFQGYKPKKLNTRIM